ncbi:MAG: hypothetical protein KJ000_30525 [Pirellulaceae bacterium]|nr:hypothetical protein [Pirellulaceae bacterium]
MSRHPETIDFWVGDLPHWEVVDGRYFVTIHLRGAIPDEGSRRIREIVAQFRQLEQRAPEQALELSRRIFREMEAWLDRSERTSHLGNPNVAALVAEAIAHRQQLGIWNMFEYVIMPSHVHMFFELTKARLKPALENFKTWTGGQAGRLLQMDGERFWQGEWFDHWSRSDEQDERIVAYLRRNPEKAGLVQSYHEWPYGGWRAPNASREQLSSGDAKQR